VDHLTEHGLILAFTIRGPLPEHSGRDYRAAGDCICPCGREYRRHPLDFWELSNDQLPYMRVLCNGDRVKL
jgi:hypothetical protein